MYHWGAFDAAKDPVPRTGLEGMHFGTQEASSDRKRLLDDAGVSSPSGQTTEVYLSIRNPIRIDDQGDWTVDDVYTQVREQVEFKQQERRSIEQAVLRDQKKAGFEALKSALDRLGYDGIVYENKYEDKGSDSYIAFRPEQVKSAEKRRHLRLRQSEHLCARPDPQPPSPGQGVVPGYQLVQARQRQPE